VKSELTVWLTPGPKLQWQSYVDLARELGWRNGEPFHPSESRTMETAFVAPDGTRIAIYHPSGEMTFGGDRRIAAYGPHAERAADAIAKRIPTSERSVVDAFHRFQVANTAVCATDDGAWWIQSATQTIAFQRPDDTAPTAVAIVHAAVAIAAGERAIYVTSCDDPRASRLGRIDRETYALDWLCELDRPTQLAVVNDVAYVAVAGGLVAVDRTGAVEVQALEVPPPHLMTSHRDAVYWIDPTKKVIVEYRGGRGHVVATGHRLTALDVTDDGLYLLERGDRLLAIERGHTRTFELDGWAYRGGILRLGPVLVTLREREDSYYSRLGRECVVTGFPQLADAPQALLAQAGTDEDACAVLVDWLADRGVRVTPYALRSALTEPDYRNFDWYGAIGSLPSEIARPLASYDRETGYVASRSKLEVLSVDDLI
jgi:hypothetical protein